MTIREAALHYYLEENRNCAEAVLLGAQQALGADWPREVAAALGAFGGGMGCGEACGAPSAATAVLGLLTCHTTAHECPLTKKSAAAYVRAFKAQFGTITCDTLRRTHAVPGQRCAAVVGAAADLLAEAIAALPAETENA